MTAYEMRISDWSSDGCSSDLQLDDLQQVARAAHHDVVRFAAGLVRLARLQGERLRLTALGAAEQLDALAPDRVDIAVDRRGIEAVAIDQPALAVAQPERARPALEDGAPVLQIGLEGGLAAPRPPSAGGTAGATCPRRPAPAAQDPE